MYLKLLFQTFKYFKGDKFILILSMVPIAIGIALYALVGNWIYTVGFTFLKSKSIEYWHLNQYGSIINFLLLMSLTIIIYFLLSWTFILIITVLASPFNSMISERVEKRYHNQKITIANQIGGILKNIVYILLNEFKKIIIIIVLNGLSIIFSWIPFLLPISLAISSVLMTITFLDFSWSRHNLTIKQCYIDFKNNFIAHIVLGVILFVILSIPILNIFFIPIAVVYFTILYVERNHQTLE